MSSWTRADVVNLVIYLNLIIIGITILPPALGQTLNVVFMSTALSVLVWSVRQMVREERQFCVQMRAQAPSVDDETYYRLVVQQLPWHVAPRVRSWHRLG